MEGKARIKRDKHAGKARGGSAEGLHPFYFSSLDVSRCWEKIICHPKIPVIEHYRQPLNAPHISSECLSASIIILHRYFCIPQFSARIALRN